MMSISDSGICIRLKTKAAFSFMHECTKLLAPVGLGEEKDKHRLFPIFTSNKLFLVITSILIKNLNEGMTGVI